MERKRLLPGTLNGKGRLAVSFWKLNRWKPANGVKAPRRKLAAVRLSPPHPFLGHGKRKKMTRLRRNTAGAMHAQVRGGSKTVVACVQFCENTRYDYSNAEPFVGRRDQITAAG
jgi:hypothetical protein